MKTVLYISLLICLFFFMSSKNRTIITDYRDAYTGTYSCQEIYWHLTSDTSMNTDTSRYTISVEKDIVDSMLTINTKEGNLSFKLKDSLLINKTSAGSKWGKFYAADSILINNIPSRGPNRYEYKGKKN